MISNPEAYGLGHADSDSVNLGSNPGPPATKTINENQGLEPATANRKRRKNRTDSVQTAAQESAQRQPRVTEIKPTCVYVIRGDNGLVKIGISRAPRRRLTSLQGATAKRLELYFQTRPKTKTAFQVEQEAMRALSAFRMKGEWFNCHPRIARAAVEAAATNEEKCQRFVGLALDFIAADRSAKFDRFAPLYAEFQEWATEIDPFFAGTFRPAPPRDVIL